MKKFALLFVVLVFTGALIAEAALNDPVAGKVSRIKGSVLAVQNAQVRQLQVDDEIMIGDILSTGADARLEISMIDEGVFQLGANTSFVVIDYTFGQGAHDNVVMELLSGAMDGVSGQIAKANPDAMKILTQQATIGIRGTRFFIGELGDGNLHVAHWGGGVVHVKNHGGEVHLDEDHVGTILEHDHKAPTEPESWHGEKKKLAKSLVDH